jgi:hypothetical protein
MRSPQDYRIKYKYRFTDMQYYEFFRAFDTPSYESMHFTKRNGVVKMITNTPSIVDPLVAYYCVGKVRLLNYAPLRARFIWYRGDHVFPTLPRLNGWWKEDRPHTHTYPDMVSVFQQPACASMLDRFAMRSWRGGGGSWWFDVGSCRVVWCGCGVGVSVSVVCVCVLEDVVTPEYRKASMKYKQLTGASISANVILDKVGMHSAIVICTSRVANVRHDGFV